MTEIFITVNTMKPLKRGTNGMGKLSPDETYIANGYYPLINNKPSYDSVTQTISSVDSVDEENKVVNRVYTIADKPIEEVIEEQAILVKRAVQLHIDTKAQTLGFDDINSIAKFMGFENKYRVDADSLAVWTTNVWDYIETEFAKVELDERSLPTVDEAIIEIVNAHPYV